MLTATAAESVVFARDVRRENGPFSCPECKTPVLLRRGRIVTHHFAHFPEPGRACAYGSGETERHRLCKIGIFDALSARAEVTNLALERDLFRQARPDVSCRVRGVRVAIEVQASSIPMDQIIKRTAWYTDRRIPVLWLTPWRPEFDGESLRPKEFERWMHAAYYGRLYAWSAGADVVPIHFEYWGKASARAVALPAVSLVDDFSPEWAAAFQAKYITLPERLVYLDTKTVVPKKRSRHYHDFNPSDIPDDFSCELPTHDEDGPQ